MIQTCPKKCLTRYIRKSTFIFLFILCFVLIFSLKSHITTYQATEVYSKQWSPVTVAGIDYNHSSQYIQRHDSPSHPEPTQTATALNQSSRPHVLHPVPTIFVITPTYTREVQKAELTKQCQTFTLVSHLHWIIIEDSDQQTKLVSNLLKRCPVNSTLLNRKTKLSATHIVNDKPTNRGASQRNIGLEWLRQKYYPGEIKGVVYFADDDNTYDIQIFNEMRFTKKVSVWPVAFAGGVRAEGPICKDGHVTGYHSGWAPYPHRKFPLDMAAFAINLDIILRNPKLKLNPDGTPGFLESNFLSLITSKEELEPKASNCTKVYVWHTETKKPVLVYENKRNPTLLEV